MSYRVDIHGLGDRRWSNNAVVYETEEQAYAAAAELSRRWTGFDAYRIVPASHPTHESYDVASPETGFSVHLL